MLRAMNGGSHFQHWQRRWPNWRLVALLAIGSCVGACNAMKPASPDAAETSAASGIAATTATKSGAHRLPTEWELSAEQREQVVARFAGRTLTLGELMERLDELPPAVRLRYNSPERLLEFVEEIVRFELLADEAVRRGFADHPDVVHAAKQAMVKRLIQEGPELAEQAPQVTDARVDAYYRENLSEFRAPEMVRGIVLAIADLATAKKVRDNLGELQNREAARLKAATMDAARKLSAHSASRERNGDTGYLSRDGQREGGKPSELPRAVVDALWGLADVTLGAETIEADGLYWILVRTEGRPAFERTLEEARDSIRNRLLARDRKDAREGFIRSLQESAKVEIDASRLGQVPPPVFKGPDIGSLDPIDADPKPGGDK